MIYKKTGTYFNWDTGDLTVDSKYRITGQKRLKDISNIFKEKPEDPEKIAYEVFVENREKDAGELGKLQYAVSCIKPGLVGDEFHKTKGHLHAKPEYTEYYFCIKGKGVLVLMDQNNNFTIEKVERGSVHYIPGHVVHRLVNTSLDEELRVGACWNLDAGHNYDSIGELNNLMIISKDNKVFAKLDDNIEELK